jgi:hypothetical protein
MTYPITTETEKLFGTGNNYEERRGKVISVNWFEAVYPEDYRPTTTEPDKVQADGVGDIEEREFEKKPDLK